MHSQKKGNKSFYQKRTTRDGDSQLQQTKKYREKREYQPKDSKYTHSQMPESVQQSRSKGKNHQKYTHELDSFSTKDLNEGKDKIRVSNIPKHILDCSIMIDEEELGVKVETRYIRKYFLEKFTDASQSELTIRRATYFPCIFFQYVDSSRKVVNVDFKDLVRSNKKKFQERPELVSVLFNQLYERVEPTFFKLALFAVKIAKDKNISITNTSIFKQENIEVQLMFYYSLSKKKDVHFTLIDKYLNFIYFRTDDIHKLGQQLPEQFDLFLRFEQSVFKKKIRNTDDRWDILENQQIEFNERDIKYIGESTTLLQKKYERALQDLNKNLTSQYMEQLNEKQNLLKQMQEENQSSDLIKVQRLYSEVDSLSRKIRQIEKVIKEIKYEYHNLSIKNGLNQWFFIKSIKKIILAEKQLTSKLPILQKKSQIIHLLRSSHGKPLIIEGETGSGKSTQLPQILIEFCDILDHPLTKPILVTQPRRLATRTLAERVALELGQDRPNNFVDYKNSIQKDVNPNAKIIFKLDRLVLDEITEDPLLDKYSCLVIDQAHERTISIDVIIGLIRNLLQKRDDFKVIITSASMDVELFQREFETKALKVSGRLFKVDIQYKDYQLQNSIDKIKKVIDEQILHDENSLKEKFKGHLLVFCSGVDQINKLTQIYTKKLNSNRFLVFPLHGKIVPEEQRKAFMPCKQHKIIFASRIAETAITIDDVRIVIDPGEDIELIYDQKYKFSSMKIRPISQSSAKQRTGRAGRTAPGFCFRLYSEKQFYERPLGKVPEMENSSLDTVVLRLKSLGIEDVINFHYISKPDKEGLISSIQNLKMIGALSIQSQITEIGELLILIPVEPMLSRSILESLLVQHIVSQDQDKYEHLFEEVEQDSQSSSMVESVIEILCMIVNSSSLFHIHEQNQNQGDLKKFQQFQVNDGDFFFLRSIYRQFKDNLAEYGDKAELCFWFKEFYLSKKALKQVKELETQILKIIQSIDKTKKLKFDSLSDELDEIKQKLRHCKDFKDVLMACLITSFIPNLCIYSQDPLIGYTLINQKRPISIYGTSTLSLIGLTVESPKWILSYDFYTSQRGKFYCKIAQGIDFDFLKNTVNGYVWKKFNCGVIQKTDPFYEKIWEDSLPTKVYSVIRSNYIKYSCGGQNMEESDLFKSSTWIFNDQNSYLKIFIFKQSITSDIQHLKQQYFQYFDQIKAKYAVQDLKYAYFASAQVIFNSAFELKSMEKIIQKDILIREYVEDDYEMIKEFVRNHLSQYGTIDIYPYSRNIKVCLSQERFLKVAEKEIQNFFNESSFKQRPSFRVIPRNERRSSQAKVILIFYVPNKHEKYENTSEKFYKILKDYCDQEDNQLQLSHKTDLEWKTQIEILLQRIDVNPENCAINIWGNFDVTHKNHEFVELRAEISSFQSGIYEKLYEFQGKRKYLGCDKLYIRRSYEQIIAFPLQKIFVSLQDEYLSMVIEEKKKSKDLNILEKNARIKNQHYFKIIGKCHNRQILTKSAQRIAYLFEPKEIQLKDEEIRYLTEIDRFFILDKLEHQFKYSITFDLNKFTKFLTVYCHSLCFEDIVSKLKSYLKKNQYVSNNISYKGKNLNEVLVVLEKSKLEIAKTKKKLEYQILFSKKMVKITTIPSFFHEVKQEIQNLSKVISEDCELCSDNVKSPFILLNCSHHFCRICLSRFMKTELANSDGAIICPKTFCDSPINIFDIQLIIGEHFFQKVADERIRNYAEKSDRFKVCPKCHLILDEWSSQQIKCDNCGYYNCLLCGKKNKKHDPGCPIREQQ